MAGFTVNGDDNRLRSGARTLLLLAAPLNAAILRALARKPAQQVELRRATGVPAQTTLRAQLKRLSAVGAIEKRRRNRFPGALEYELSDIGRELLFVADVANVWLGTAPQGPLALGDEAAKAAIKALTDGWSTTILRALAAKPCALTELDHMIPSHSYPALERRLGAMRLAGQIEMLNASRRGRPCTVTTWTRHASAPLIAASRWERKHLAADTPSIGRLDIETAFLLALPLLSLPDDASGVCTLAVEVCNGASRRSAGVTVEVTAGEIASCATQLRRSQSDAWALGPPAAWMSAVIEQDSTGVEIGGDSRLARILLDGLHRALFGVLSKTRP